MNDHPVECHSGFTYAQRPIAVQWEDKRYEIETIQSEWRTPEGKGFRVLTTESMAFELFYEDKTQSWTISPT